MALDQDPQAFGVKAQQIAHARIEDADGTLLGKFRIVAAHRLSQLFQLDLGQVAALLEIAGLVINIGDAARHAGGEIAPGLAQHRHHAAGHIFAAMIAGAFDYGHRAGIAHRKTLARHALEIGFAGDGAIQHSVADHDIFRRIARKSRRRLDHDAAARQALADIIVAIADQLQRHAARQEGAEALPGGTGEADLDGIFRQAGMAVTPRHFARQHGAHGAVHIADGAVQHHRLAMLDGRHAGLDQLMVDGGVEGVVLRLAIVDGDTRLGLDLMQDARQIHALSFPMGDGFFHVDLVHPADHFGHGAEAQLRHDLAQFLGNKEEVIDHMLGRAGEALAQHRVLGRHPHRTGVEMAFAHHDAA